MMHGQILTLITYIILFITLSFASGCSSTPDRRLASAEALMEQHPDSAMAIIDSINPNTLSGSRNQALYSLLSTQARYKNYINDTNDSIISTATDYYRKHGPDSMLMKALFLHSVILYNNGEYPSATSFATEAMKIAGRMDNDLWTARTAEHLADLFCETYIPNEELKYRGIASKSYLKAGKISNHIYAEFQIGVTYLNYIDTKRGIAIIDSMSEICDNPAYNNYFISATITALINMRETSEAIKRINQLKQSGYYDTPTAHEFCNQAELSMSEKKFTEAARLLDSIRIYMNHVQDTLSYYGTSCRYYLATNNLDSVSKYYRHILDQQNMMVERILDQSVVRSQRDYMQARERANEAEAGYFRTISLLSALIILILIISGGVIFRLMYLRSRYKDIEIEKRISDIQQLSAELTMRHRDLQSLTEDLKTHQMNEDGLSMLLTQMFEDKCSSWNIMCHSFAEGNGDMTALRNATAEISSLLSPDRVILIEETLDRSKNQIISRLRSQCPSLSDDDVAFAALLFARLSKTTICLLRNISSPNFYKKRSRIIDRISSSHAPDAEEFIAGMAIVNKI